MEKPADLPQKDENHGTRIVVITPVLIQLERQGVLLLMSYCYPVAYYSVEHGWVKNRVLGHSNKSHVTRWSHIHESVIDAEREPEWLWAQFVQMMKGPFPSITWSDWSEYYAEEKAKHPKSATIHARTLLKAVKRGLKLPTIKPPKPPKPYVPVTPWNLILGGKRINKASRQELLSS
jgi:hypothetical protein